jgi:anti-sigma regulatory factor (Ser/Thr protein kinase)
MSTVSLAVPATLGSLADIASFVLKAADAAGLDRAAAYNLRLAVEEFATNAVTHGSATGQLDVLAEMDDNTLRVVLEDGGVAFDPRQVPPPDNLSLTAEKRKMGGLGIFLALQGIDQFFYERVGDRNRNILVVNRPSSAAP